MSECPFLRHRELAALLGVSPCTLSRWLSIDHKGIRAAQWIRGKYLRTKLAELGLICEAKP